MNIKEILYMAHLQKVSFCNTIHNNLRLFSAHPWKKIIIALTLYFIKDKK